MLKIEWQDNKICAVITNSGVTQFSAQFEAGVSLVTHKVNGTPAVVIMREGTYELPDMANSTVVVEFNSEGRAMSVADCKIDTLISSVEH